jgi:methionyl aminopeptidase
MDKIIIKTEQEIEAIRKASRVTAQLLTEVAEIVKPGINTEEINEFVHKRSLALGAIPAPLNYKGFPKSVCTSINEVVCHGIPSRYIKLNSGDIINIDITSIVNGYFGDASRMYFVGGQEAVSQEAKDLVRVTLECLEVGIAEVAPGKHFGDIGAAIQAHIKKTGKDYGIVREYTGHGIGKHFHEEPQVIHVGKYGNGPEMRPGMTFTIEPMINLGTHKTVLSNVDGWTVRTKDGKLSAQWEHTVLVTESGVEILTQ